MSVNASNCNFGWKAKDFQLLSIDANMYGLADLKGKKGTIIAFICNHCPYVKAIASIGAVFDFFSGTKKRPNKFIQNIGLEWFFRFLREPKRLWGRVFLSNPIFIFDVLKYKYFRKKR